MHNYNSEPTGMVKMIIILFCVVMVISTVIYLKTIDVPGELPKFEMLEQSK